MKKHMIVGVEPGSIAHELSIKPGDHLLTVNQEPVRDVFDYQFFVTEEYLTLEIEKRMGISKKLRSKKIREKIWDSYSLPI